MGRWVRETVTAGLDGRAAAPDGAETRAELAALRAELSKVGSNLNQIARALNVQAMGGPVQVDQDRVLRVIEAVKLQLGGVREQLAERSWR